MSVTVWVVVIKRASIISVDTGASVKVKTFPATEYDVSGICSTPLTVTMAPPVVLGCVNSNSS